nr:immunoglobulin light chain junction region [Macaca mulatta]MOW52752.1 immunoglobulin light chain junction region [Macaca mulatta]MOW52831.1 immunoglobulin light chain junction region [Macaca mulatta]MOW53161.1 immunoglobulin light chain junction region [Macaca mulatta]MOW53920.1 immunoglobulin light chain junction region [Macaca mulatta]
CQQGYSSPYSF